MSQIIKNSTLIASSLLIVISASLLGCAEGDMESDVADTARSPLAVCTGDSTAPICNPTNKNVSKLSILQPLAGDWPMYYMDVEAEWLGAVGRTNSLTWTLTFDPDGSGPQTSQSVVLATGTLAARYTIPGNLVPFNDCLGVPGTVKVAGYNSKNVLVSSSVSVSLLNGNCWIN